MEGLYRELDEDMLYGDKDGYYEWEDIADKLYMSQHKVLCKRNILIDKTAERLGGVNAKRNKRKENKESNN